jgi:hypothetical protein
MSVLSHFARHAFAALSALAISTVLFANVLATSASDVHSVAGILA